MSFMPDRTEQQSHAYGFLSSNSRTARLKQEQEQILYCTPIFFLYIGSVLNTCFAGKARSLLQKTTFFWMQCNASCRHKGILPKKDSTRMKWYCPDAGQCHCCQSSGRQLHIDVQCLHDAEHCIKAGHGARTKRFRQAFPV